MSVYAGLDGGSTYLKAALIDQNGRVLHTGVTSTGIDNNGMFQPQQFKIVPCRLAQVLLLLDINRPLAAPGHKGKVHSEPSRQVYQRLSASLWQPLNDTTFI